MTYYMTSAIMIDLIFGVLTPLSAIFQLYHGEQLGDGRIRGARREPPTMGK
jgi:hypothetical protein